MIRILCGLPASGKTRESLEWVAADPNLRRRINYDDLRVELFGSKGNSYFKGKDIREREKAVKAAALSRTIEWIKDNPYTHDVVIDNTNLTESARAPWTSLAQQLGVEVVIDEIDTPIHVCVDRDRRRQGDDRVGRAVIDRMALTTGWIDWDDAYHKDTQLVVVDIDGTLSDPSHRLHWIRNGCVKCGEAKTTIDEHGRKTCCFCFSRTFAPTRWDLFHAEVDLDPPKPAIISLVAMLSHNYDIIIVSGRSPEHGCGIKTEEWLEKYLGIDRFHHLFMRAAGDYKPDYVHKQEILDLLPKDRIAFVLDDRDQVVEMWRKNGLTCLQVAKGDF